jgi:hypothetical protein
MSLKDLLTAAKRVNVFNSHDGDRTALANVSHAVWAQACL